MSGFQAKSTSFENTKQGFNQQIPKPVFAHKLSVCGEVGNIPIPKAFQKLVEQIHAFSTVGIAPFVEQTPDHWEGNALMHDA